MPHRYNHYDQAFEAYLREHRRPYVSVDETRRALAEEVSLKSPDFVVSAAQHVNLLIDVKGRKFGDAEGRGHRWENWVTQDDVTSLLSWEKVFGRRFRGILLFAYHLVSEAVEQFHAEVWSFRRRSYAFYAVDVREYAQVMRPRSVSWQTVSLPAAQYRRLRSPLGQLFDTSPEEAPVAIVSPQILEPCGAIPPVTPADV